MKKNILVLWVIILIFIVAGCSPVVLLSVSQRFEQEGDELASADRTNEAILAYHQAVTADVNNRTAMVKLIPLYHDQGRTRKAWEIISRLKADEKLQLQPEVQMVNPENLDHIKFHWIQKPGLNSPVGISADAEIVAATYPDGLVSGLKVSDGSILWSQKLSETITSPPAISLNIVLVGCESGKVIALDRKQGDILWEVQLPGAVYAGVLADGSTGYIASYNGAMAAINLVDGKIIWQMDTGSPILAGILKANGILYFGTVGGSVYSVDAEKGISLWEKPVQLSGGIESMPVLAGSRLLIGTNDSRLYALDLNGKDYYWTHSTTDSIYASPLVDGNTVFGFSIGQVAAAIDLPTGSLIWEQELPVAVRNTPVMCNAVIYFAGTTQPFLYQMDAGTGKITGQANTGDWIEYGPIEGGGYLLLAGKDGAILAYQIIQD